MARYPRAALVCPSFFDGRRDGIGRVSGAFAEGLARVQGTPPVVLSANDPAETAAGSEGRAYGRAYGAMLRDAFRLRSRGDAVRRAPVVCTHLGLAPAAAVLARRWRLPLLVFIHGVEAWRPLRLRSRIGLTRADRLAFNSVFTRRLFLRHNPWAVGCAGSVVPLGLAVERLGGALPYRGDATDRMALSLSYGRFRILCVARISRGEYCEGSGDPLAFYKGFVPLILAAGRLAEEVPGLELVIVGDGDGRVDLEEWLAGRPERAFVTLAGRVSDEELEAVYGVADVFALPSEREGFGLVYVEAMARGLPCVIVDAGAAPEVVEDGVSGLVARPRDVADLADKLRVLALNPVLRRRLGDGARRRFEERYGRTAFDERIRGVLAEATAGT